MLHTSRTYCSTINTAGGLSRVNHLQMGLKNSSTIFQHCMESVLAGISGVKIYQDNILIHAPSLSKLKSCKNVVMDRLEVSNVAINEHKSIQRVSSIDFLGFNVSGDGIRPSRMLVSTIQNLLPPQNQELQHFIGVINYYCRLIPKFADHVEPLLINFRGEFIWSPAPHPTQQLPVSYPKVVTLWLLLATPLLLQSRTGQTLSKRLMLLFGVHSGFASFSWDDNSPSSLIIGHWNSFSLIELMDHLEFVNGLPDGPSLWFSSISRLNMFPATQSCMWMVFCVCN